MSTVFNGKIFVKDTQLADNNDKVTAISSQGEIKETNVLVSDLGSIPNLQDVTTEGGTTNQAVTVNNSLTSSSLQVNGNATAYNFTAATGQVQAKILKAAGDLPLIQINDTDAGGSNIELRPHAGTYDIDITTPIFSGQLARVEDIPDSTTTSYDFGGIISWSPAQGGKTTLQLGNSNLHNVSHFASSIGFTNTTGNELIDLQNNNYSWGYTLLTDTSLTTNVSLTLPDTAGTLALTSDIPDASTTSYDFGGIVSWSPAQGGKTTLQLGNSNLHNVNNYASNINFTNTTGDNLIFLQNDNYSYGYTLLTNTSLTQTESLTLPNGSGDLSLIRTINTSTVQTTATLNSSFPNAEIGARVVNLDTTERYTYTKISSSLWRRSDLMTDI
jgi:hypothetical protein